MESEKFPQLIREAGASLADKIGALTEHAEHFIAKQVEVMKERGDAVELGEDELRLLKAYRGFKARNPANAVFSWRTPDEPGIVLPEAPSLIVDPREVCT